MIHRFKIVFLAVFLATAALIGQGTLVQAQETYMPFTHSEIEVRAASGESYFFDVEMALTAEQQSQGLMFRKELKTNQGMLFVFNNVKKRAFWMKNTLIPLDMLFIAENGEIHHIHHNAKPQDLTAITSLYPSKAVLELKGSSADILGIKEGDVIIHPVFHNDGVAK